MTRARISVLSVLLAAACGQDLGDSSFRSLSLDVDAELMQADGGDGEGTIIWEILEAEATQADGGDDEGTIIWEVLEFSTPDPRTGAQDETLLWTVLEQHGRSGVVFDILDPDSERSLCHVEGEQLRSSREHILLSRQSGGLVADDKGPVVAFDGDSFLDPATGEPILTATTDLDLASAGRQLTIAALVTGVCRG